MKIIKIILFLSLGICREVEFKEIQLSGLITDKKQEISGLEWYQDNLVLLPENLGGFVYMIPKERIKKQLRSSKPEPLEPRQVSFKTADYSKIIPGFQGFEAIAFKNEFVAITLEAKNDKEMHGYYAWGTINPESFEIMIPEKNLLELPVPVQVKNFTFESLLIHEEKAIVYFEANGRNLRENAWQYTISLADQKVEKIDHPSLNIASMMSPGWTGSINSGPLIICGLEIENCFNQRMIWCLKITKRELHIPQLTAWNALLNSGSIMGRSN